MSCSVKIKVCNILALCILALMCLPTMACASAGAPFVKGETLNYTIEKFKVKVGEASIVYGGVVEAQGRRSHLLTVTANGFQFYDKDEIFLDEHTFKPIMVRRDLDIFGNKEEITEYYDHAGGKVRIVKIADGKTTEQIIEGELPFDHIHGFILAQRLRGGIKEGEEITLNLPTREVLFPESKIKNVRIKGKKYNSLYMQSKPKQFKVYFDTDNNMIPLRINGAIGVGNMSMIFIDPNK